MRVRLALLLVGYFIIPAVAFGYTSPGAPTGYVNDFANLLSDEEEASLEKTLSDFDRETSNQISVVTITTLDGDTVENFATKLFAEWGIGGEKNDNGILLLVSRDEREVRIEVGYGLEGALTDIQANDIIENAIVPAFRDERYGEGVRLAVGDIMIATRGEYVMVEDTSTWRYMVENSEIIIFGIIFALQWIGAVLARSKSWWGGGVVGAVLGVGVGVWFGWLYWGVVAMTLFIPVGLLFDYVVSNKYKHTAQSSNMPWWMGGGHGGSSGGFGGFSGGMSGGGGASGRW